MAVYMPPLPFREMPSGACWLGCHHIAVTTVRQSTTKYTMDRIVYPRCLIDHDQKIVVVLARHIFRGTFAGGLGQYIPAIFEGPGIVATCFFDEEAAHPRVHRLHAFDDTIQIFPDDRPGLFNIRCCENGIGMREGPKVPIQQPSEHPAFARPVSAGHGHPGAGH